MRFDSEKGYLAANRVLESDVLVPRRGYRTQPRVSTLGIVHQKRHALKGQDRTSYRSEAGSDGPIVDVPIGTLTFAWQ